MRRRPSVRPSVSEPRSLSVCLSVCLLIRPALRSIVAETPARKYMTATIIIFPRIHTCVLE